VRALLTANGKAAGAHGWQIDDVIDDEGRFFELHSFLTEQILKAVRLSCIPWHTYSSFKSRARREAVFEQQQIDSSRGLERRVSWASAKFQQCQKRSMRGDRAAQASL